jgi:hypothetical protein
MIGFITGFLFALYLLSVCVLLFVHYISQGTQAIEGLVLKLTPNAKCFSTKAFENMKKLRLLQLSGVHLDGDFKYLSRRLRWLCWKEFPLTCMPSNFDQRNLVSIELENSNIKLVWKEMQVIVLSYTYIFSIQFLIAPSTTEDKTYNHHLPPKSLLI